MALGPFVSYQIPGVYGPPGYDVSVKEDQYVIGVHSGTLKEIVKKVFVGFCKKESDVETAYFLHPFRVDLDTLKLSLLWNGVNDCCFPKDIDRKDLEYKLNQEFERYLPLLPFI